MKASIRKLIRHTLIETERLVTKQRRKIDVVTPSLFPDHDHESVYCLCSKHIRDGAFVSFLLIRDDLANALREKLAHARVEIVDGIPVYVTCMECAVKAGRGLMGRLVGGKIERVNDGIFERYRESFFKEDQADRR